MCDTGQKLNDKVSMVMWSKSHALEFADTLEEAEYYIQALSGKKMYCIPFNQDEYPSTEAMVLTGKTQVIFHDTCAIRLRYL